MEIKYFNALLQVVMSSQIRIFVETVDRETLLRNVFEKGIYIPVGEITASGWGVGDTRYITEDNEWVFGFLHKVIDSSDVPTIAPTATSLNEVKQLDDFIIKKTPFFFNFNTQRIYTQSHWAITRASNSASEIWKKILSHVLEKHVLALNVQSIPERESFLEQMENLKVINMAEFDLFGPNILNDERIRGLLKDFQPTGTEGLIIMLKNFIKGLKTDTEEFMALLSYLLRGGGKGKFTGKDKQTNNTRIVRTESKNETILVSIKLHEKSSEMEIVEVLTEITNEEANK